MNSLNKYNNLRVSEEVAPPCEELEQKLSDTQRASLEKHEQCIQDFLLSFIDVGMALQVIRDERLYRENYPSFEDYCRNHWGYSRQRAYQLIDAARVADYLSTRVDIEPTSEAQVRPLVSLSDEQVVEVWNYAKKLAGTHGISGPIVKLAVAELQGHEPPVRNDFDRKLSAFERGCEQIQKFADETANSGWTECRKERLGKAIRKVLSVAMNLGILDDHRSSI